MKKVTKNIKETDDLEKRQIKGSDLSKSQYKGKPLGTKKPSGEPIEYYDKNADSDVLGMMQYVANQCAANAKEDMVSVLVSGLQEKKINKQTLRFFVIQLDKQNSYAVYQIGRDVYYRPTSEFIQIATDIKDHMPGASITSFTMKYDDVEEPIDSYSIIDRDDCIFLIYSIFSSLTGKSYETNVNYRVNVNEIEVNENCKIRKHNKLGTDGLAKNSKKFAEAKYRTPEENAFTQEVEAKQKQDGTVGCLDQQQQESVVVKPKLPNIHYMNENKEYDKYFKETHNFDKLKKQGFDDIEYEPGDKVLVGKDKLAGVVTDVYDTIDNGQMITVMVQGHTIYCTYKDVTPDPTQLSFAIGTAYATQWSDKLNLDMRKRMHGPLFNEDDCIEYANYNKEYEDMNGRNILCNVVLVDDKYGNQKLNYDYCYASMKDILESKQYIRVINESGDVQQWPVQNLEFDEDNWPYAVVVDGNSESDEPLRKIRINPTSYVEAGDEDFVECIVGDKLTKMIKKNIKIIS